MMSSYQSQANEKSLDYNLKAKTIKAYTRRASVYLVGRQVFALDKQDVVPLAVILVFFTMPFVLRAAAIYLTLQRAMVRCFAHLLI